MILTIGHSTRPIEEFLALLAAHRVTMLVDVRLMPGSRRHPHFSAAALARSLQSTRIGYRHMPALGGMRKPRKDSLNTAWRNASFRGYADYMETEAFDRAVDELLEIASPEDDTATRGAIMCAEAVWWQCHRQMIADALVARGCEVAHVVSAAEPTPHALTRFARVVDGRVRYQLF